jgi:hypothetical protein
VDHRPQRAVSRGVIQPETVHPIPGSPHPCSTDGAARPGKRRDSTALGRRSLIRMRSRSWEDRHPPGSLEPAVEVALRCAVHRDGEATGHPSPSRPEVPDRQPDPGAGPQLLPHGVGQPGCDPRSAPDVYDQALRFSPSWPRGAGIACLLALAAFIALLAVGVLRRWHWTFWLILVAFLAGMLHVPGAILQLTGILRSKRSKLVRRVPGAHWTRPARHRAGQAGRLPALWRLGSRLSCAVTWPRRRLAN